ncbi:MAG: hypothetical protein GEU75_17290 [Dehalococcoidia bacterium]|nr:hypothetical protein [Dehalococcoidia bacterium]
MNFRETLEAAVWAREGRLEGMEVRFLCPVHDDHHPSARWNSAKAVWCCDVCGAGGGCLDLAKHLGVELPALEMPSLSVEDLALAKSLPAAFLRSLGVGEGVNGTSRVACVDIHYLDSNGNAGPLRKRVSLNGRPRFLWRRGDKPTPYGLWRLDEASQCGYILLVEGESDSWTLWHAGLPALGIPGADMWKEAWKVDVQNIKTVYVWREADAGGDSLAASVAADIPDVRIIEAPADAKDPNELWQRCSADIDAFTARIEQLLTAARPASQLRSEALTSEVRALLAACRELLDDPGLLDRVGEAMRQGGYAGDLIPPKLVYVALTSRLLERPLNVAVIAQSGSGKNRAVDAALALVPEEAYYLEKAGSARALIYTNADFQHKVVVVAEADSIPEEGSAASAVRSLAADNFMSYDVVEKDQSGQFMTRRIEKPGPTGLITTSTKHLGEQMSTRMLTCSVPDTSDQTRAVLLAHAASVNGEQHVPDLSAFIAHQRWLEIAGGHEVVIPFAQQLAHAVPAGLVRMRRDFRQLLTVIQTHAMLHQLHRQRDSSGRIIAEMEDYRVARDLLLDVFTASASGGVTQTVRDTVAAVTSLTKSASNTTAKAVGDLLGLQKETAWYRVKRALSLGYLLNEETRKGHPAKLVLGDPLPEDRPALPTVEELMPVCADPYETASTVQPQAGETISVESEPAVESTVESAIQPHIQPPLASAPESESPSAASMVERLNGDPHEAYTPTHVEADRVYARALAETLDFPSVRLSSAEEVSGGEDSWDRFVALASPERLSVATRALEDLAASQQPPT